MPGRRTFSATLLAAGALAAAVFTALALTWSFGVARAADPLTFTLRTIDSDAGVRVVIEFNRKPQYEVRAEAKRIYVTLHEGDTSSPFKKRDFDSALLEKIKFADGFRTSEIVLYTGPEFGTFSTFEMGEPFRLVLDLRKRSALPPATRLPGPGEAPPGAMPPPPGTAPGPIPPGAGAGAGAVPGAPTSGEAPRTLEPLPEGHRKAGFTIVIDPGHGGEEEGAHGPTGLREKDVTLDVARRLKSRLAGDRDTEVILTRDDDRRVALDDRTAVANHAVADLFVSIHANSSRRDSAHGSETYFVSYQATDDESRAVAALENNTLQLEKGVQGKNGLDLVLWDLAQSAFLKESSDLAEAIQDRLNDTLGVRNRGIKQAPFRVLMGATMPAVLVEIAFISSPDEEKRLRDAAFKDRIADALAESIRRFRQRTSR
jgi:N-acetylmuramoyl-L-alanine amidase